ncbi:MAG: hypothetical protein Q9160_000020 [Pyrenula sp. 1 TL-2023]
MLVGIGLAVAHFLLKAPEKHNLVVVSRDQSALERLRSEYPDQVAALAGDVCDYSIAPKAVELALSTFGEKLDGLVINQGILKPVAHIAECRSLPAIPALRKSGGRIVLVSSGAAVRGVEYWGAYGSSKAAMNHLAQTLQVEEPDITTVAIRPGTDDLTLPKATVQKIVSEILPQSSGVSFNRDARDLLIECCVEFITLLSSEANDISEKEQKKTIAVEHIEKALTDLGFSDYVPDVLAVADEFKDQQKTREKKQNKIDMSGMSEAELVRLQQEMFSSAKEKYHGGPDEGTA